MIYKLNISFKGVLISLNKGIVYNLIDLINILYFVEKSKVYILLLVLIKVIIHYFLFRTRGTKDERKA